MNQVLLIGAGASFGTLGDGAPTSPQFGAYLRRTFPRWDEEFPFLGSALRFFVPRIEDTSQDSWALHKVWGAIDNRVKLRFVLGEDLRLPNRPRRPTSKQIYRTKLDDFGLAGFELRCLVSRVYGRALEEAIRVAIEGNGSLRREVNRLSDDDCIISFNYDVLVEEILRGTGRRFAVAGFAAYSPVSPSALLLCKPHGCLSWRWDLRDRYSVINAGRQPMDDREIDYNPELDATLQPAIVPPVPYKEQIVSPETQFGNPSFFLMLVAQWRAMVERISRAESLTVMGYGFPAEDLHAQYIFTEANTMRRNDCILAIRVYQSTRETYSDVCKAITRIFNNVSLEYAGPVEP